MILIKSSICPKCKREFIPAPFNVYKIKSIDFCSYTCYMAAKRALPTSTRMSIPILAYTVEGEFVGEYAKAKDAARELYLNPTSVYRCLHGKQRQVSGYVFTYKELKR